MLVWAWHKWLQFWAYYSLLTIVTPCFTLHSSSTSMCLLTQLSLKEWKVLGINFYFSPLLQLDTDYCFQNKLPLVFSQNVALELITDNSVFQDQSMTKIPGNFISADPAKFVFTWFSHYKMQCFSKYYINCAGVC